MRIIQMLPILSYGDAVGNHTITIKRLLRSMGYETEIYAAAVVPPLDGKTAKTIDRLPKLSEDDVVIYHLSTGHPLNEKFARLNCRKIVIYHNITPPGFFEKDDPFAAYVCWKGLQETKAIKDRVDYCITVSEYNKSELRRMGYKCPIDVVPILIPFKDYKKEPNAKLLQKLKAGKKKNIIFTGRVAPNKKHEDIIAAFAAYKKYYGDDVRLTLVGNYNPYDMYAARLHAYVSRLGVRDVHFTGHVKFDEILAYFKSANLFICMSEHEGFGVPLAEAMMFKVPILAYDSSAVGETLNGSGFLINDKSPEFVAGCMHRILTDQELRKSLIEKEQERLKELAPSVVADQVKKLIQGFVDGSYLKEGNK
ncbi:MAG: glycosyltransferase family 4 protein [Clostridiales bacterium]|nr:glycosyltransferase family 4 protein [Clostridiales bacterium]